MASSKKPAKKAVAKKPPTKKAPAKKASANNAPKKKKSPAKKPAPLTPATNTAPPDFIVRGSNATAAFTLTIYRGEGMCLLAMNWRNGTPPVSFVGFAIEYKTPGSTQFNAIPNRINFPDANGNVNPVTQPSTKSPFQKFRWVHFPPDAGQPGIFTYRVTAMSMDNKGVLSNGDVQTAGIELVAETYPGELNICFTRGFIASQAFVDNFGTNGGVGTIIPTSANAGLDFKATDPNAEKALAWMGFEARSTILGALDQAIADPTAQVRIAAYDFNDLEIVSRAQQLKGRLKIVIDDSGSHGPSTAPESRAAAMLVTTAGAAQVQRQHMGDLQHNKTIVVDGDTAKIAIGGSTNLSWRGIYVQNNNAVVLQGPSAVQIFNLAFDNLFANPNNPAGFGNTPSAGWNDLGLTQVNAKVAFSPHSTSNAALGNLAIDIASTQSSLFYSLAFLYETPGVVLTAIEKVTANANIFVYGLSDKSVGGLDVQRPDGNPPIVFPGNLLQNIPPPFKQESAGGSGTRLHHKFVVIDFNKPNARVYTGSYNFSIAADTQNGENLFLITDQRVATSYMIEGVAMFDHYEFRDIAAKATTAGKPLELRKPPAAGSTAKPWWDEDWTNPTKKRDRELFGS